jgi:hypothetical protein
MTNPENHDNERSTRLRNAFCQLRDMRKMRLIPMVLFVMAFSACLLPRNARAESRLKRIYFNLYTDSIKTVLHYYVNVEGEYSDGRVLPMDTSLIRIIADRGIMSGNDWIAPKQIDFEKVTFHAIAKDDPRINDRVTVWLKRLKDPRDEMDADDMDMPVVPDDIRKRRR